MRLLIAVDPSRVIYLNKFASELSKFGIEVKIISEFDIYDDSILSQKYFKWFQIPKNLKKIIQEFNPDYVFTERVGFFSSCILKLKIPLIIFLRGDYWNEVKSAKEISNLSLTEKFNLKSKQKIAETCFKNARLILPICNYLKKIVDKRYPNQSTYVLYQGIDSKEWFFENREELQHPCVGIIQDANVWEKTKEMLILPEILEKIPNVNFYWAGDGQYAKKIVSELEGFTNFHWLGRLKFPNEVREIFNQIDIYALVSGLDMSPHTILEAGIMKKPVLATDVGGISELIKNNETGILIKKNDSEDWIKNINELINSSEKRNQIGDAGYRLVEKEFSWVKIAQDFVDILKKEGIQL
jgi:glycosyltransferase involved in cell wall biosynthesis